jgi:hypothetical protein
LRIKDKLEKSVAKDNGNERKVGNGRIKFVTQTIYVYMHKHMLLKVSGTPGEFHRYE